MGNDLFTPLAKKIKVPGQKVQIGGGRRDEELGLAVRSTPWICILICGSQARCSRLCLGEKKKFLMWVGEGAVDYACRDTGVVKGGNRPFLETWHLGVDLFFSFKAIPVY